MRSRLRLLRRRSPSTEAIASVSPRGGAICCLALRWRCHCQLAANTLADVFQPQAGCDSRSAPLEPLQPPLNACNSDAVDRKAFLTVIVPITFDWYSALLPPTLLITSPPAAANEVHGG